MTIEYLEVIGDPAEMARHEPSKYERNSWNTRLLVLNVMATCARWHDLDIHNDDVADELYWICSRLEDWPEDEGFGSSDHYSFSQETIRVFHLVQDAPRCPYCGSRERDDHGGTLAHSQCTGCGAV